MLDRKKDKRYTRNFKVIELFKKSILPENIQ